MAVNRVSDGPELVSVLRERGLRRGADVALALVPGRGLALAVRDESWVLAVLEPAAVVAAVEAEFRPRWVWWSRWTPSDLAKCGVRVAMSWDLTAVHRLLFGGGPVEVTLIWAALNHLPEGSEPAMGQLDLLGPGGEEGGDGENPIRADGHLRPEWVGGGWQREASRWAIWARLALRAATGQRRMLAEIAPGGDPQLTARSESAAEMLCVELQADGLPLDRERAESLIAPLIGHRPRGDDDAHTLRRRRDDAVRTLVPGGSQTDLRNPAQVRTMLAAVGIDVPDTRSWRLEALAGTHPVVEALLWWRKSERIATTYGYRWLDEQVGSDGRLRGVWSASDGGAGRMSAQAGLHNLPVELRSAVVAEPGQIFVRADLGQIEPRVLAAVSADPMLARASAAEDLYAPIAQRLGVERATAKVAVLAAMYGQTSGTAGEALRGLEAAYPIAMRYLREAYDAGRAGQEVRTHGGRLIRISPVPQGLDELRHRAAVAARGRFARNAVIQGAAAEVFKAWAVTVRSSLAAGQGRIVLCLHDELLVQTPIADSAQVARLLERSLEYTARLWFGPEVRFVADTRVIGDWSLAKD